VITRSGLARSCVIVQGDSVGFDLVDRAVESTKTTLGLKLLLSLAWHGERGLGDYVASLYDLTRRFYERLSNQPGISCPYEPESNILCFRVEEADQLSIRDRLLAEERLHIGTTTLNGKRHLRLVLMSSHTDAATLDDLLRAIAALRS
jgi:L-2,4-diaminobutyrate decarboxylase